MKIGLVTNWNEKCGVAEYAKNLVEHCFLQADLQFKIISEPLTFSHIYAETRDVDLIHFNYASGLFREVQTGDWDRFAEGGKKLLMTFHDSSPDMIPVAADFFDRVVVHTKLGGPYASNVVYIPQGIRLVDGVDVPLYGRVGTAGFPFPWKGFSKLAVAARQLGIGCLMVMADSWQIDARKVKAFVHGLYPAAEIIVDWLSYDEIVRLLASDYVNVFPYDLTFQEMPMNGISAGVRFGLSAKRPIIVSRCKMFQDLLEYEDEIYFTDDLPMTIVQVYKDIAEGKAKVPNRILHDMNWFDCATKYLEVYRSLLGDVDDFEQNDERGGLSGTDSRRKNAPLHLVCDGNVVASSGT